MLTWIEINAAAFHKNIATLRSFIEKETLLMPVVKANAYGHGLAEIGKLIDQESGIDRVCVASLSEALYLRSRGLQKPLIVLSFFDEHDEETLLEVLRLKNVSLPVYTLAQAKSIASAAQQLRTFATVHVKIDVGTSRLGVLPKNAVNFLKSLQRNYPMLVVEGIFSHFSSSEEDQQTTETQARLFTTVIAELEKQNLCPPLRHCACSASAILYPSTRASGVRVGLGIYGLQPSPKTRRQIQLEPVLSFHTRIIQLKTVEKGTAIGYGRTYLTKRKSAIATLPIGYYDGFDREFSNNASVLIRGRRFPVRGRICMNLTMVEIPCSFAQQLNNGEEVVILGKQGKAEISADEWAKKLGTISYEVVTRLGSHIPRIIV